GSIRISRDLIFNRMRGFYTETGLEDQRKYSPLALRCEVSRMRVNNSESAMNASSASIAVPRWNTRLGLFGFFVRSHRTFRSKDKYGDRISPSGEAWVSRRITCFDQLTLCFKFSKYFPVYISVRVQG